MEKIVRDLESILKELSIYESRGLDTSSLRLFVKNLKTFKRINAATFEDQRSPLDFSEKLDIIQRFLEDKRAFPKISDVIEFANRNLDLDFRDQKQSRPTTIRRIVGRIDETPELKEKVKFAVLDILSNHRHKSSSRIGKRDKETLESFSEWAEILRKI